MLPNDPFARPVRDPLDRPPANGLGIAGFVVSLVGLFSCGCLSIVGIIVSGLTLKRRPRGFAIAGLVIGLLGLVMLSAAILVVRASGGFTILPAIWHGSLVADGIQDYQRKHNGAMPTSWSDLPGGPATDLWGRPYRFELLPDGQRVQLVSDGADGVSGTPDDVFVLIEGDEVDAEIGHAPTPL